MIVFNLLVLKSRFVIIYIMGFPGGLAVNLPATQRRGFDLRDRENPLERVTQLASVMFSLEIP